MTRIGKLVQAARPKLVYFVLGYRMPPEKPHDPLPPVDPLRYW